MWRTPVGAGAQNLGNHRRRSASNDPPPQSFGCTWIGAMTMLPAFAKLVYNWLILAIASLMAPDGTTSIHIDVIGKNGYESSLERTIPPEVKADPHLMVPT